jgi:putative FmdB family regulatory protein
MLTLLFLLWLLGEIMPIYEYRCSSCGAQDDVIQKMSDAPLTTCPVCGKETYAKQVSSAGFQLKGDGYYVTDFKNSGTKSTAGKGE